MTRLPQISEAEFEVMKIVWQRAPVNTNEITESLEKTTAWSPKTIQTLIKRKAGTYLCLHSSGRRKGIYWAGKLFFSETFLPWGSHRNGFLFPGGGPSFGRRPR